MPRLSCSRSSEIPSVALSWVAAHDAGEIARQAAGRIHAQGKMIRVDTPSTLPPVLIDDVYLGQVLANLLENAVRYGGHTIVVQGLDLPDEGAVELSVADDGEGVPVRALGHLFDKFYQVPRADALSRRGMGIGLTVVAGLAHAMGGTVRAEHSDLGGLAVVVTLRAADAPPPDPGERGLFPTEAAR